MVEAAAYMGAGRELYLVVSDIPDGLEIRGQVITGRQLDDLNRGREYVKLIAAERGYTVYESIEAALGAIVAKYGNKSVEVTR